MACIKELFVEDKYSGRDLREWKLYRNFGKWYQKSIQLSTWAFYS